MVELSEVGSVFIQFDGLTIRVPIQYRELFFKQAHKCLLQVVKKWLMEKAEWLQTEECWLDRDAEDLVGKDVIHFETLWYAVPTGTFPWPQFFRHWPDGIHTIEVQ